MQEVLEVSKRIISAITNT